LERETRFHQIVRWFQDHRLFAWVSVVVIVVSTAGTFVGSIDTIVRVYHEFLGQTKPTIWPIDKLKIQAIPSPVSYGYVYDVRGNEVEKLPGHPDYLDHPEVSTLALLEDGAPLPEPHSAHDEILEQGMGRYSHWQDDEGHEYILFSSSDNSDPGRNDFEYTLVAPSGERLALKKNEIEHSERKNFGYRFRGEQLTATPANSDCDGESKVSELIVLEIADGHTRKLGPAHSSRHEIEENGEGRYNHCKDGTTVWLFFSTSDNKDPRKTGRDYALTVGDE